MKIPFSIDEFLNVFENYNLSVWPIQILFYFLALIAIVVIIKNKQQSSQIVFSILAFFWGWMGFVYHIHYFSSINKAAYLFGAAFITQSLLLLYHAIKHKIQFKFDLRMSSVIGTLLIVYALILYPLLGYLEGRVYPRTPTFGVPCPTTIFTFGLLLFSSNRIHWHIILIPFLWSLIGFIAALNLLIRADFGLGIAGVISTIILLYFKPKIPSEV